MAAFDTALTPVAVTPANTSDTTLDPDNTDDAFIYVDVANIGSVAKVVRVGVTPSGGSVHWKMNGTEVPAGDSILGLGPWFLQAGDVFTVGVTVADDVTFSLTGAESSA
jgi:hypothetical protein